MRIEIERLEAVLPATELVGVLKNEIARLRNQVEQLQREVADAKRWAMQERTLRWHSIAAEGLAEAEGE